MDVNFWFNILQTLITPTTLFLIFLGTFIGIILGAIPGLGAGIGVVLLLPFTYGITPELGLLLLGGVFMGNSYGGAVSGILLNVPGTPVAAMTTIEGYPMALHGRAKEALLYSLYSSFFGGIIGVLALIFFTPPLAALALRFGPAELFLVAVLGLTVVAGVSGKSLVKGIFSACAGIVLSLVGQDPVTMHPRFTWGSSYLASGLGLIPLVVGLFAFSEMFTQIGKYKNIGKEKPIAILLEKVNSKKVLKKMLTKFGLLCKTSILGTIIGIIPGTGAGIASFVGYAEAQRTDEDHESYGKGNPNGIIGAESANNSAVGGALVPLLALGIPGSATSAIFYGALTLHGLIPGPRLFSQHAHLTYVFMIGMLFTVIAMLILGVLAAPIFSLVVKVKMKYIIPSVTAFSLIGAYSARNSILDMTFALFCGVIGLIFRKALIPIPPMILGFILGPMVEENLRRSIIISRAQDISFFQYVFLRPISLIVMAFIALLVFRIIKKKN